MAKPDQDPLGQAESLRADLRLSHERVEELSQALAESKKIIQDREKQWNEMLSVCAHDLKSPLSSIMSFIDILRSEGRRMSRDELTGVHDRIERAGHHMWELINDLLDASQLESGEIKLTKEMVLISQLCRDVLQHVNAKAEAKGIKLQLKVPPGELKISLDPKKGMQILDNLLSNALKFTPRGGQITVRVMTESNKTLLIVEDTGQGIAAEELELLFKRFRQTSTKSTDGERGTGLGLSIVNQLVALHSGQITVDSKVGQGSRFQLSFPVAESSALMKLFCGQKQV
jgi:signal transduction histidine kinase